MKNILLYILLIICLIGCKDDFNSNRNLEPSLSAHLLSPSETRFDNHFSSAFSEDFTVNSTNTAWKFTDVANWLTLSPESGTTTTNVTLSAQENMSANSARTAIFYLTSTDPTWSYSRAISVSQGKASPHLSVSETTVAFGGAASQQTISVEANCTWSVTCTASWIKFNSDFNPGILNISVDPNPQDDYRNATAYIEYGSGQYVPVTIKQSPASISSSVKTLIYENVASKYNITIDAETDWTSSVSDSWIYVNPDKGKAGQNQVSIEVTPNTSLSNRTGFVEIKIGSITRIQIKIIQKGIYIESEFAVTFTSLAESREISIQSNTAWIITSKPEWISLSKASGVGDDKITLTTLDNPNTTSRSGEIVLSHEGLSINRSVRILQLGKNLSTDITTLELPNYKCQSSFNLISDASWTSSQSVDWITTTPASGQGNAIITVNVDANDFSDERTGIIKFSYADTNTSVNVHQLAKYMIIDNQALVFDSKGGTHTIDLSTNDEWTAEIENNPSWLKLSKSSGSGSATITLTADDNASVNSRSAVVLINTKYSQSIRILVSQEPRFLTLSTQSVLMFVNGGLSETVSIETNATYDIKVESSWFTVYQYAGNTFKVNATQNVSSEMRSGKIIISLTNLKEGSLAIELPVIQAGKGGTFIINGFPEDINWDSSYNSSSNISINSYTAEKNWN